MTETDFTKHYISHISQMMWFIGAGVPRTAGMPTASDIVWTLKLRYYCLKENQDIKAHDITNDVIKRRVQSYMDSKGFPALWSANEYSFYFDLTFGNNYAEQQKFLAEQLANEKISLNIGHRVLAALIATGKTKLVFTTNFDEVIESAYAYVAGRNLSCFHLEGSYAALEALNAERFPIYAKIHGDFKYQSIKNLASDLLSNDKKIQDCFLTAGSRFGMVVAGYSGRDSNVMEMFYKALEQHNAFPAGLIWTVPSMATVGVNVLNFIEAAQQKGINAHLVEAGTFDIMLSKIWKQLPDRPVELDLKVRAIKATKVSILLPPVGKGYPILRTNALPVIGLPNSCAVIGTVNPLSNFEVKELIMNNKPNAVIAKTDSILAWGNREELVKCFGTERINLISKFEIADPLTAIAGSTMYHAFFERGLVRALCEGKPLNINSGKGYYVFVDARKISDSIFQPLKDAVGFNGQAGNISGRVPNSENVFWAEAIKIKTEIKNGRFWVLLSPTIWIDPALERKNYKEFTKSKIIRRYNAKANAILDAWISILFGNVGHGAEVEISCFGETEYPIKFKVNTRTAFSRK